jgi:NTP pyrophosphatase (non-canonical NTP hydrolase)
MKDEILNITKLKNKIEYFASERDWNQFHTPKNLAMALSVEASELVEIFQWLTQEESLNVSKDTKLKERVAEEVSDVLTYAIRLCDILNIDMEEALLKKIVKNGEKYPVEKAKGSAKKYSDL